jgi:hypothetical protein
MDPTLRDRVKTRAHNRCEYCLLPQEHVSLTHHLEHIVARKHGGTDTLGNLALACHRCNLHKGSNLTGMDPATGKVVGLFHPRRHKWSAHFRFEAEQLLGRTAMGRATVQTLAMNDPRRLELRKALLGLEQPELR